MTLKQLAEELNKHNKDKSVVRYRPLQGYTMGWIQACKKDGIFIMSEKNAKELLKTYKEGK